MIPTSFPSKEEIARLSAQMLLEIGAVDFNAREPFQRARAGTLSKSVRKNDEFGMNR